MSWIVRRLAQNNMAQYNFQRVVSQIMLLIMAHIINVKQKRSLDSTGKVIVRHIVIKFNPLHKPFHKPTHHHVHKPAHNPIHNSTYYYVHKPNQISVHKPAHNPILQHNYNFF